MVGTVTGCGSRRVLSGDQGPPSQDAPSADAQISPDAPVVIDMGRSDGGLPLKQRVARACAFAQACAASVAFPLRASECVEWFAYRDWPRGGYSGIGPSLLDRLLGCAPAQDCKSFHSCFGGSWVGPTACRDGGECSKDKNMLYTQSNNAMFLHCNVLGGKCVDLPTGAIRACCATKTCAGTSATTCHPNPGGSSRKGTHCLLGIAYDFDCAPMGQFCSPVQGQLCVGPGAYCDPKTTPVSCTGSVAKYCVGKTVSSGNIANVDCAKNGLHSACNGGKTTGDPCRLAGSQCNAGYAGACQGNNLLVCVDGYKVPVDCAAIGFDLCGKPPLSTTSGCMYAL